MVGLYTSANISYFFHFSYPSQALLFQMSTFSVVLT